MHRGVLRKSQLSRHRALTQIHCYRAAAVASLILLPVRGLTGAIYGEATQHDDTTGIDSGSRAAISAIQP